MLILEIGSHSGPSSKAARDGGVKVSVSVSSDEPKPYLQSSMKIDEQVFDVPLDASGLWVERGEVTEKSG